jgi:hypothetical protein
MPDLTFIVNFGWPTFAGPSKGDVMADSQNLQISIGGSPLAIIDGQIYALLMPDMAEPATWTATSGALIQFTDQASGRILSVPDASEGIQAAATVPRVFAPVTAWEVARLDSDGNPSPVTEVTESGFYSLQAPDTDLLLARREVEDYSIRPKAAVLGNPDSRWQLIIQLV